MGRQPKYLTHLYQVRLQPESRVSPGDPPHQMRLDKKSRLPTLTSIAGIAYPEVAAGIDLTRAYRTDRVLVSTGMTHRELRQMSIWPQLGKFTRPNPGPATSF